ncbi:MAG: hypothetical protein FJ030_11885 [Chloroflexi bacterium]|nr:hypothetical protein [Chloroflexota bacterium]
MCIRQRARLRSFVLRPSSPAPVKGFILLITFALRAAPLTDNRFHPDEALYAAFARLIASGRDPLLSTIVADKPPLPFYLMAASMTVFGGTEFAARLPSLFASLITVAILHRLTRTIYNGDAATFSALTLALSPMAILFAITLFTDTLLAAFIFFSLLCAARQQWSTAGWAFGLAFACKQTALFFLPLIIAFGITSFFHRRDLSKRFSVTSVFSVMKSFLLPTILCAAAIFLWDFARHAPISFWIQGYADNNPGRLVRSNEIWPRLSAWIDLLRHLTGSSIINIALLIGLPLLLFFNRRSIPALHDFILAGFTLAFLAGYWLLAFNVWDRYLLILTPIIALLTGRLLDRLAFLALRFTPHAPRFTLLLSFLILLPSSLTAARSGFPIGGDHGAYDGIDEIAATLRGVPPGSVLYDHWLSWELGFYLFDGPTYFVWMPGPGTLADDLKSFGHTSPRFIVSPSWESFAEAQAAIESAGFTAEPIQQTHRRDGSLSFTLYQVLPSAVSDQPPAPY